jgi:hypothetical protein
MNSVHRFIIIFKGMEDKILTLFLVNVQRIILNTSAKGIDVLNF